MRSCSKRQAQHNSCTLWRGLDGIAEVMGQKEVSVNVTPNGYGDAVTEVGGEAMFVKPEERRMPFDSFAAALREPHSFNGCPYLSHQRDSLTEEFGELLDDIEPNLSFAAEAFGTEAEAVNLWIGEASFTSLHKDHFENTYCVLSGQKIFTLLPPSDVLFLYEQPYKPASYSKDLTGSQSAVPEDSDEVLWIPIGERGQPGALHDMHLLPLLLQVALSISLFSSCFLSLFLLLDPVAPDLDKYPAYKHASPVTVEVNAGECLYLPALWYHHVRQRGITTAVNYWHDMKFDDPKYVYYEICHKLARHLTPVMED
ncbi:unnamed protein product [Chrysoparadoxa australica]